MKIAVLGCGTVGGGVVKILRDGVCGLELVRILDLPQRFDKTCLELYTDDFESIVGDAAIDLVVETMGGHDFSYSCIKRALSAGKHVVTANKEVIALHLKELTELAEKNGVYLMYEASAGGGIPCLKPISNVAKVSKTMAISGILNGTTNYVLTRMQDGGLDYYEALAEAQEKGFAEKDPTSDVEGLDMLRKIAIISMLCFKQEIKIEDVYHFGITGVTRKFIEYVNSLGYTLKYTCFAYNKAEKIEIGVEPVLVKTGGVIAGVKYETNIVKIVTTPNDEILFVGKGAGRMPTAAAIVCDAVTVRDGGERMVFEDKYSKKVGLSDELISAVVDDGETIKVLTDVNASLVRGGKYKFYARITED